MAFDLDKIRAICERVTTSLGLELVEVEFKGGAGKQGRVLRIVIDRAIGEPGANASMSSGSAAANVAETSSPTPSPQVADGGPAGTSVFGVSHEDCARVSQEVGTILDVEDPLPGGEYMLEVSSPGLDRKLEKPADFQRFTGSRVKLMTREPLGVTESSKGNRHFEGRLERFDGVNLTLDVSEKAAKKGKHKTKHKQPEAGQKIVVELRNVEKANLVPEI